jgi:hypothetical protein
MATAAIAIAASAAAPATQRHERRPARATATCLGLRRGALVTVSGRDSVLTAWAQDMRPGIGTKEATHAGTPGIAPGVLKAAPLLGFSALSTNAADNSRYLS